MRNQKFSTKRPSWLTYATEVKSEVNRLRRSGSYRTRRENLIYRSYQVVREKHGYVGTLGDWDFILQEAEGGDHVAVNGR
jgi:hypothetical protein